MEGRKWLHGSRAQGGNIYTKRKFADCQIHIEWASPAAVKGNGQGRGNSGVFPLGFGEIQVLDSFQNDTYPDGQAAVPRPVPAAGERRPAAGPVASLRFSDPDGEAGSAGAGRPAGGLTVFHDGVVVHYALELPAGSGKAPSACKITTTRPVSARYGSAP